MPAMKKLILSLAAAAVLAGCASTPTGPIPPLPAYRETAEINGKISVNYRKNGSAESLSGRFTWQQQPGKIDVELTSPLGQTVARIQVTPTEATLMQSDQVPRSAASIDALTAQALGWQLPVGGMKDWMQGYATDAQGQRDNDRDGHSPDPAERADGKADVGEDAHDRCNSVTRSSRRSRSCRPRR